MKNLICVMVFVISGLWVATAVADESERDEMLRLGVDPARVEAAVKKGAEFLKAQQAADGSWKGMRLSSAYPEGVTALCGFALVKTGEPIDSDCIQRALAYLKNQPFKTVYSVSTLIMFLSALATPPSIKDEAEEMMKDPEKKRTTVFEPEEKRRQKQFKKLPGWIQDWLKNAVEWLISKQMGNIWRYPGPQPGGVGGVGPNEDASNTQYAVLALHCAMQVGISVPSGVFQKIVPWFLENQEKDGPEVKGFRVPAADLSIDALKKMEKELLEMMRKKWEAQVEAYKDAKKKGQEPPKLENPRTQVIELEDPYKKFGEEPSKMKARGWSYINRQGQGIPQGAGDVAEQMRRDWVKTTGSMTTSGVICLIVAKSQIEKGLGKEMLKALNQGIRDGFAWFAHNWTVSKNPNHPCWHLYYLYGIERCAALGLVEKIGEHNWYKEGAEYLLGAQKADGSWEGESEKPVWAGGELGVGPVENTCFALLFLLRATIPIIKPPTGIFTGEGLLGPKKPSDENPDKNK
ncbi:MAG: hypothetical protein N2234_02470 [Planctomycetota bacterium]|nr:hypothetical protein [Planctomycetota bacterium]